MSQQKTAQMPKIIVLQGLPASGKSTWAKAKVKDNPGQYARVNKDDLRAMMHVGRWSKSNEKLVIKMRDHLIAEALAAGQHVIVDDTNLHPKHYEAIRQNHKGTQIDLRFFDETPETCIKRDLRRCNSVGDKVIKDMHKTFLKPPVKTYKPPEGKPRAIIVDIDGTIAHMNGRSPYDMTKVDEDSFDQTVSDIAWMYAYEKSKETGHEVEIILLSGREDSGRDLTEKWLEKNDFSYHRLLMRKAGDDRKDSIVKKEISDNEIRDNYQIDFVLDDRDQVVDMWRNEIGLKCLQVAEGDF